MSAFANCGRAVAHVRGSYVLCVDLSDITLLVDQLIGAGKQVSAGW